MGLTVITIVLLPFIAIQHKEVRQRIKKKRKEAQRSFRSSHRGSAKTIQGARIIKVFNREDIMTEKFVDESQRYYREMLEKSCAQKSSQPYQ